MKKTTIITTVGISIVAVGVIVSHQLISNSTVAATPVNASYTRVKDVAPAPQRVLTPQEQAFVDQACRDSANQKIYDTCKQEFLDTF